MLTCATDMAIGRHADRIYSLTSPDAPEGFTPRGLSCGFVKVDRPLKPGQIVRLKDKRRAVEVEIVGTTSAPTGRPASRWQSLLGNEYFNAFRGGRP